MDELTQIESRLSAALDDLEAVREFFIEDDKDDFERQFTAFDAQEKIETVLHYIRQITHKEDTMPHTVTHCGEIGILRQFEDVIDYMRLLNIDQSEDAVSARESAEKIRPLLKPLFSYFSRKEHEKLTKHDKED